MKLFINGPLRHSFLQLHSGLTIAFQSSLIYLLVAGLKWLALTLNPPAFTSPALRLGRMPYVAPNDSPYHGEEYYQPEYHQATYYQPQASTTSWPAYTGTMSGKQRASEDPQTQSQSDDWENISDPAERRKVQNRIAQRKFRMHSLPSDIT